MHRTLNSLFPGLLLLLLLFSTIPVCVAWGSSYRKAHQRATASPNRFAGGHAVAAAPAPAAFDFPSVLLVD